MFQYMAAEAEKIKREGVTSSDEDDDEDEEPCSSAVGRSVGPPAPSVSDDTDVVLCSKDALRKIVKELEKMIE